jgi:hypothetical protein
MNKSHNFKLITNYICKDRKKARFHCKDCDSIVEFPFKYSEHDINHIMNNSKMICLPPVYKKN